jgi:hypothetical protein
VTWPIRFRFADDTGRSWNIPLSHVDSAAGFPRTEHMNTIIGVELGVKSEMSLYLLPCSPALQYSRINLSCSFRIQLLAFLGREPHGEHRFLGGESRGWIPI